MRSASARAGSSCVALWSGECGVPCAIICASHSFSGDSYNRPAVHNLITFGGQHMGVVDIPGMMRIKKKKKEKKKKESRKE